MQDGEGAPCCDQPADEFAQGAAFGRDAEPVEPCGVVVLSISIVVAALSMAKLVASEDHRRPVRQQGCRKKIALLPLAELNNLRVVGRSLDAVIPGMIIRVSVAVVLAIGLVMFVVVGHDVVQCEAVMRGTKLDG